MKSIKIDNHKESGHRFQILIDWLVSMFIDFDRFWSSIGIIDVLRPEKSTHTLSANQGKRKNI